MAQNPDCWSFCFDGFKDQNRDSNGDSDQFSNNSGSANVKKCKICAKKCFRFKLRMFLEEKKQQQQ
jgi:Pyruvate/2-oxoacid:ferredoxin oxidoreductase delta subunit